MASPRQTQRAGSVALHEKANQQESFTRVLDSDLNHEYDEIYVIREPPSRRIAVRTRLLIASVMCIMIVGSALIAKAMTATPSNASDEVANSLEKKLAIAKPAQCPNHGNADQNCGWTGIAKEECEARGCCFDFTSPGYWCYAMTTSTTTMVCSWHRHRDTYATGPLRWSADSLGKAKAKCIELGPKICTAITCSRSWGCSVRQSPKHLKLKASPRHEVTYVPSSSCFEMKSGTSNDRVLSAPPSMELARWQGTETSTFTIPDGTDDFEFTVSELPTTATFTTTTPFSTAALQEFYMYRAVAEGAGDRYPLGNINTGNIEGVMWYLMNEVVTWYSYGSQCPRKFNISKIKRYKVQTQATKELWAESMNFGVRFAFDRGECYGRCFGKNMCTGHADCRAHFMKYGFFVGCNNFWERYPFPDVVTSAPRGVWYSLPVEGRCNWASGAHNCTWSYQDAGEISLEELEASASLPLKDTSKENCCNGKCTSFWDKPFSVERSAWRAQQAMTIFASKYPAMPRELPFYPKCDFQWKSWYAADPWDRQDPWAETSDGDNGAEEREKQQWI